MRQSLKSIGNLVVAAVVLAATAAPTLAQSFALEPYPPAPPSPTIASPSPAERALPVFNSHCARCHEAGRGDGGRAPDRFGYVLRLDALARDPSLVTPGRPDASPLYQRMLDGHRPADVFGLATGGRAPTPAEIEAVRDWIASLPKPRSACEAPGSGKPAESRELAQRWLAGLGSGSTRFVSLNHLVNACEPASVLGAARATAEKVLTSLADSAGPVSLSDGIHVIGDDSALLALRLKSSEMSVAQWASLTENAPVFADGMVPADWLAVRVLEFARARGAVLGREHEAAQWLARFWERDVDLRRAAAELDIPIDGLRERLLEVDGDDVAAARRLLQGMLPRARWERLRARLTGTPPPPPAKPDPAATKIDLALWSDKPAYAAGELLTINVQPDKACHLTLVAVDPHGQAIVIYPNEMEPDNLIAPGVVTRVPSPTAPYVLRLDEAGEETIIAVCQRTRRHIEGVALNYERQRFPVLGDWRGFLRRAADREAEITRRTEEHKRRRRARREQPNEALPVDPSGPALAGRAAITIPVD